MKPDDIDWRGLRVFTPNFKHNQKTDEVSFVFEFVHTLVWQ